MKVPWIIGGTVAFIISILVIVFSLVAEMGRQEREYWDALCKRS